MSVVGKLAERDKTAIRAAKRRLRRERIAAGGPMPLSVWRRVGDLATASEWRQELGAVYRDLRFEDKLDAPVSSDMTPQERLVTAPRCWRCCTSTASRSSWS
jgi:hypothetical protein